MVLVGVVTATANEAERVTSHLSRFGHDTDEQRGSTSLPAAHANINIDHSQPQQSAGSHSVTVSRQTSSGADVSDLLFDNELLPGLPPPLIPVPDSYQPLVDVEKTVGHSAPKSGECSVCMESEPNAALYPCGHMCLCYGCAVGVQKLRGALCPICRQPIVDILRIYRT